MFLPFYCTAYILLDGFGIGVYSYFKDYAVNITSGIVSSSTSVFVNALSVFLNGHGGIDSVLNGKGGASVEGSGTQVNYVC